MYPSSKWRQSAYRGKESRRSRCKVRWLRAAIRTRRRSLREVWPRCRAWGRGSGMGGPFGVRGRGRSAGRYGRGGVPVSAGLLLFLGWILRGWYQENDGCESPKVGFPLTTNPLLQSENPHPLRPNQPRLPLPPNLHPSLPQLHVVDHFLVRRLPRPLRTPRPLQAANLHALRRLGPHGRLRRAPRAVRR